MYVSLQEGVLNGFAISFPFPKELSLVAVCMDDTAMQLMLTVLIIDYLTVVHQCLDMCNKILGGPLPAWPQHP